MKEKTLFYLLCHRSFLRMKYKRKTEFKEKNAGSIKVEKSCPAMMKVVLINNTVEVEFCSTHVGHECDIGRLHLNIEERNLLAGNDIILCDF